MTTGLLRILLKSTLKILLFLLPIPTFCFNVMSTNIHFQKYWYRTSQATKLVDNIHFDTDGKKCRDITAIPILRY